jgi:UDP-glucose 4-epimerase
VFAHTFGIRAVVLRFPNVVGERATHGVIYDFLRKIEADRSKIVVLGDGKQSKPYLYAHDLIGAIMTTWDKADAPFAVYHAAGVGQTCVCEIAEIVIAAAGRPDNCPNCPAVGSATVNHAGHCRRRRGSYFSC